MPCGILAARCDWNLDCGAVHLCAGHGIIVGEIHHGREETRPFCEMLARAAAASRAAQQAEEAVRRLPPPPPPHSQRLFERGAVEQLSGAIVS
jgi:hypothetical protein